MKIKLLITSAAAAAMVACTTNPITGRKSVQLADNSQIEAMALQQYKQTLSEAKVVGGSSAQSVKNVGNRIRQAAERYYQSIGRSQDIAGYQWEFNLIDDKQLNAWCMPGGKVAVYTGILPVTKNDTGLAVVMGHEISHALAGHGNERITQAGIAQGLGQATGMAINQKYSQIFSQLYPIGSQVVLLKYGRNQELEADQMGLYLMGMAGYNPQEAAAFWERMEAASGRNGTPEFLSTHPNPGNRIANLEKNMPKALEYYRGAGGK